MVPKRFRTIKNKLQPTETKYENGMRMLRNFKTIQQTRFRKCSEKVPKQFRTSSETFPEKLRTVAKRAEKVPNKFRKSTESVAKQIQ